MAVVYRQFGPGKIEVPIAALPMNVLVPHNQL
jgi:hypothetical protein